MTQFSQGVSTKQALVTLCRSARRTHFTSTCRVSVVQGGNPHTLLLTAGANQKAARTAVLSSSILGKKTNAALLPIGARQSGGFCSRLLHRPFVSLLSRTAHDVHVMFHYKHCRVKVLKKSMLVWTNIGFVPHGLPLKSGYG